MHDMVKLLQKLIVVNLISISDLSLSSVSTNQYLRIYHLEMVKIYLSESLVSLLETIVLPT